MPAELSGFIAQLSFLLLLIVIKPILKLLKYKLFWKCDPNVEHKLT